MVYFGLEHRHQVGPFKIIPKIIDGCIGGALGVTFIYPIDLVKTRLQNQRTDHYTGLFDCLRKTYKTEGFLRLYKGCPMNAALMAPETAVKMTVNDFCRRKLSKDDGSISISRQIFAGAAAGTCQSAVSIPMELIKIQLQDQGRTKQFTSPGVSPSHHPSSLSVIKEILKTGGFFSLFKGGFPTILRNISFAIIYFPLFANINKSPQSYWWTLSTGFVAASTSAAITTPLDVVKTRIQTLKKGKGEESYRGVGEAICKIVRSEGLVGLLRGMVSRSLITGSMFGISQMVYFSDFTGYAYSNII